MKSEFWNEIYLILPRHTLSPLYAKHFEISFYFSSGNFSFHNQFNQDMD